MPTSDIIIQVFTKVEIKQHIVFLKYFNVLHTPRRQTLTCHVKLLIWQEMLPNALCNHMKRAAGQRANCINFERVSLCVCVCGWEWVEDVCVQGGIITGWFNLLYSIFDEVNLIFLLACPRCMQAESRYYSKTAVEFSLRGFSACCCQPISAAFQVTEFRGRSTTEQTPELPTTCQMSP